LVLSSLVHVAAFVASVWFAHPLATEDNDVRPLFAVEVDGEYNDASQRARALTNDRASHRPTVEHMLAGGVFVSARPDLGRRGRGGSGEAPPALNLASSIDELLLERETLNHADRSQVQRTAGDEQRRTQDDRRATREPTELWLSAPSSATNGMQHAVPPERIAEHGIGTAHRTSNTDAAAALQRLAVPAVTSRRAPSEPEPRQPEVPQGREAVPATTRGATSDNLDSQPQVASRVPALIQASTPGGSVGEGSGGMPAPGRPASGAETGFGSQSRAGGTGGRGPDDRVSDYLRKIRQRVDWSDAFPEWAIAQGRSGVAVVRITMRSDGTVAELRLLRSSGVREFDENVLRAIERAAPFDPIPAALGRQSLALNFAFDATNPAVGRSGRGPGGRTR
jgi:TonB family protein